MFKFFKEKTKEKENIEVHNRLIDIRIGRKYARIKVGNKYEFFNISAEEAYERSLQDSDDLKAVNKHYFIEGYTVQSQELSLILRGNLEK